MELLKIFFLVVFSVFLSFKSSLAMNRPVLSRNLGSQFVQETLLPQIYDINRLLPIIIYSRLFVLDEFAKRVVKEPYFKPFFNKLEESKLKMLLRLHYYIYTKGKLLDSFPISFVLEELAL